jgi:2,5-furandicarboxylate decarboxylase 1
MAKDLRSFIEKVKAEAPEQFLEIKKEIDCCHEIPALLQYLEDNGKYPMVLFDNVKNVKGKAPSLRVISNVGAARERVAMAIDSTISNVAMEYVDRNQKPIEPIVIDKKKAPVKEVITTGKEVDLFEFPIITHHEMDIGPYISAGDAWTKDPDTGEVNCALIRMYAKEPQKLTFMWAPVRHTNYYYQKYVARNEPMPMVIVIGHHLAFFMGAQTKILGAELRTIGAMLGEPLELVPSETWGDKFYVPARAEIVIEAEISPSEREIEAPFGEYTGYYGGQQLGKVGHIKAITRRKDAILHDIFAGHRDHLIMDGPNMEAVVLSKLRDVVPTVTDVYMPPSGKCRFHAYVRLKKTNDAEPKSIIATALTADFRIKHVWVVDDDVDVYNDEEIIWAMATRFQGDEDLVMIRNMMGSELDPSVKVGNLSTKIGFDCTKPAPPQKYEKRVQISREVLERVRKAGFLTDDEIKKLV